MLVNLLKLTSCQVIKATRPGRAPGANPRFVPLLSRPRKAAGCSTRKRCSCPAGNTRRPPSWPGLQSGLELGDASASFVSPGLNEHRRQPPRAALCRIPPGRTGAMTDSCPVKRSGLRGGLPSPALPGSGPGGRRPASELSPASQPFRPAPGLPGTPFGPAPSITSQTTFTVHDADDGRLEPKARPARAQRRVSPNPRRPRGAAAARRLPGLAARPFTGRGRGRASPVENRSILDSHAEYRKGGSPAAIRARLDAMTGAGLHRAHIRRSPPHPRSTI